MSAPERSAASSYRSGIYSPDWTEHTYDSCLWLAEEGLARGNRVLVDASFSDETQRRKFLQLGERWQVPFLFLHCQAPAKILLERLAARSGDPSDASEETYLRMRDCWTPLGKELAPWSIPLETSAPPEVVLECVLNLLEGTGLYRAHN